MASENGDASVGEVFEVEHFLDVGLKHELNSAILGLLLPRLLLDGTDDWIHLSVTSGCPMRRIEPAAGWNAVDVARLWSDQECQDLPRAHEAQAPIVVIRTCEWLFVGVACDLEVARAQRRVAFDDLGNLLQDFLPIGFQSVFAGIEKNVARKLNNHPVVADNDLEADARQLVETTLQVAKAGLHIVELLEPCLVLGHGEPKLRPFILGA